MIQPSKRILIGNNSGGNRTHYRAPRTHWLRLPLSLLRRRSDPDRTELRGRAGGSGTCRALDSGGATVEASSGSRSSSEQQSSRSCQICALRRKNQTPPPPPEVSVCSLKFGLRRRRPMSFGRRRGHSSCRCWHRRRRWRCTIMSGRSASVPFQRRLCSYFRLSKVSELSL